MSASKFSLLFGAIAFCCTVSAQTKNYSVFSYGPKQWPTQNGVEYDAETIAIAQDSLGIMYFGTNDAIWEFDGRIWNRLYVSYLKQTGINKHIKTPNSRITSILVSKLDDRIYIGAQNEFGFFYLTETGYEYESLSDKISEFTSPFGNIWKIFEINGSFYFQCEEYVFIFNGEEITTIEPLTSFHNSFCLNNMFYVREREIGLMRLNGTKLDLVSGGDIFSDKGVFGLVDVGNNTSLILTYEDGSWLMKNDSVMPNASPLNDKLFSIGLNVTSCVSVDSQTLALGSFDNGILVITTDGNVIAHKNINNGLIDNTISAIFCDREHNLWVTTKKGISLMPSNKSYSFFSQESGINSSVNAVCTFNGKLYIGTDLGLIVQNDKPVDYSYDLFVPEPKMKRQVKCLSVCNGTLLVGTSDGLFQMSGKSFVQIGNDNTECIAYNADKDVLLSGGSNGLAVYRMSSGGIWMQSESFATSYDINSIETELDADGFLVAWLGSNTDGIIKIVFDGNNTKTTLYSVNEGVKYGLSKIIRHNGDILFLNENHIIRFVTKEETAKIFNISPDSVIDSFDDAELKIINHITLLNSNDNLAWISCGKNIGVTPKGDSLFHDEYFKGLNVGKINSIFSENGNRAWVGATNGLVLCEYDSSLNVRLPFYCLIRSLIVNDSALSVNVPNQKINYHAFNKISFVFSAPWFMHPENNVEFSYMLQGHDKEWSEWNTENKAEYKQLKEGRYAFKVKARNVIGNNTNSTYPFDFDNNANPYESTVAEYHFTILPPWYRTVFAFFIYFILLLSLMYGTVKIFTYRLKKRNEFLDKEVKKQTVQIENQLNIIKEQNESLTDSINYAARIQRLSLPNTDIISKYVSQSFILFKPRDIVSGDFYWCAEVDNKLIITAADCTGHGVPGAMMSMLGMNSLNSIVKVEGNTCPGKILDELRDSIIRSFADKGEKAAKDGMDICLLCVDPENMKLHFAGAHNSLLHIRNGELTELKVDKFPCALTNYQEKLVPFNTQTIDIEKGDCFYFMSDGFCDQFGGSNGNTKFMKKRLKSCLSDICNLPLPEQGSYLEKIHNEFRGSIEQIDDILVIGIKI